MRIDVSGNIKIVSTVRKPYWYKRAGYWVGDRFIAPKRIKKFKDVPLKTPYLYGHVQLVVHEHLRLGGTYVDHNGVRYRCTATTGGASNLMIENINLGASFSPPLDLILIAQAFSEG